MERSPTKISIGNIQIIAIIVLVIFCVALFFLRTAEKTKRKQIETSLIETIKAKDLVQKSLDELKANKADLEAKVTNLENDIKTLNEFLSKEKEEKNVIKSNLDAREVMISELNTQLDREKSEKQGLVDRMTKYQKDYDSLKSQVDQLSKIKSELEKKVNEFSATGPANKESGVELEKIVVSSESKLKGEVLVVNRNLGFLVINLGTKDGIAPGTILGVYRNDSFLGEVQVEKIYETISSANILPEWENVKFKEGDKAIMME